MKTSELKIKNALNFGRFSLELEEKREQSIITQSSHMLTAFSLFSAAATGQSAVCATMLKPGAGFEI